MTNFSRHVLIGAVASLCFLLLAAGVPAVTAQQDGNTTAPNTNQTVPEGEHIDNATILVDSSVDLGDETAQITLYSEIPQRITISDSGAFVEGGEVPQRTITLKPDEQRTIEMPITVVDRGFGDQFAGVSIATPSTLYAEPLETSSPMIGGPWTAGDVQLVGIIIGSGVSIITLLILIRSRYDLDADPERVA